MRYFVPYSELAMHCKIAGKVILKWEILPGKECADVWTDEDPMPTRGLVSEVLPFELRETLN